MPCAGGSRQIQLGISNTWLGVLQRQCLAGSLVFSSFIRLIFITTVRIFKARFSSGRCKSKHSLQHGQRWHSMSFDLSASSLYHEYSTYVEHVRGRSLVSLMVQTGRAPPMFAMSFLRCMLTLFKAQCGPVAERSAVWHSDPQIWTSQKCWWNLDCSFLGQQALYPSLRCTLRMLPCLDWNFNLGWNCVPALKMARTQPTGPWYFTPRPWMAERCVGSLWEPLIDWKLMNLLKGIPGILCFCRFAPRSSQCVWKPWKILEPRGFQRLQWLVASCKTI